MKKTHLSHEPVSRTIFSPQKNSGPAWVDQRPEAIRQAGLIRTIQQKGSHAWPELPSSGAPFIDRNPYSLGTNRLTQCIRQSAAPLQLAVVQRTGDDIDDALWAECLEMIGEQDLDKTNKDHVGNVLWALNDQGGDPGTPMKPLYDRLVAAWNKGQKPEDCLGKPTDQFRMVLGTGGAPLSGPVKMHPHITLLGSDRFDPASGAPRPGNLLLPAIQKFFECFKILPGFMGGYLDQRGELYGKAEKGKRISPLNIQMLEEDIAKRTMFLCVHPHVEGSKVTAAEIAFVKQGGDKGGPKYVLDVKFVENVKQAAQVAEGELTQWALPSLYRPDGDVSYSADEMNGLIEVAKDYIETCRRWVSSNSAPAVGAVPAPDSDSDPDSVVGAVPAPDPDPDSAAGSSGTLYIPPCRRKSTTTPSEEPVPVRRGGRELCPTRSDRDAAPRPFRGARTGGFGRPSVDADTGSDESLERRDQQPGGWLKGKSQGTPPPRVEKEERGGRGGGRGGGKYTSRGRAPRGK